MASVLACVVSHSTRKVAFELYGMRPFTVISPWARRSPVSADDVTVAPRTGVAGGVLGLAAHGTDGPPGLHELARPLHEARRLRAGDVEPRGGALLTLRLGGRLVVLRVVLFLIVFLVVRLDPLVGHHHDAAVVLIVADAQRADRPRRLDRLEEGEVGRRGLPRLRQ